MLNFNSITYINVNVFIAVTIASPSRLSKYPLIYPASRYKTTRIMMISITVIKDFFVVSSINFHLILFELPHYNSVWILELSKLII